MTSAEATLWCAGKGIGLTLATCASFYIQQSLEALVKKTRDLSSLSQKEGPQESGVQLLALSNLK